MERGSATPAGRPYSHAVQDAAAHWDDVYASTPLESASWFETRPEIPFTWVVLLTWVVLRRTSYQT